MHDWLVVLFTALRLALCDRANCRIKEVAADSFWSTTANCVEVCLRKTEPGGHGPAHRTIGERSVHRRAYANARAEEILGRKAGLYRPSSPDRISPGVNFDVPDTGSRLEWKHAVGHGKCRPTPKKLTPETLRKLAECSVVIVHRIPLSDTLLSIDSERPVPCCPVWLSVPLVGLRLLRFRSRTCPTIPLRSSRRTALPFIASPRRCGKISATSVPALSSTRAACG